MAATALAACGRTAAGGSAIDRAAARGRLSVGYIPYFEIGDRAASGDLVQGFTIDLLGEVLAALGHPGLAVEYVETSWDTFAVGLEGRRFDFSIAGTFITPVREKVVDFTRPIFHLGNGAVIRAGDERFAGITSVDQLDQPGLRIAVVIGEYSYEYVTANFKQATIQSLQGPDLTLAPQQVLAGRADVAMSDQFILSRFVAEHGELVDILRDHPYNVLPIAWAVRKGDAATLEALNRGLAQAEAAGVVARLQERYPVIPFASPPPG